MGWTEANAAISIVDTPTNAGVVAGEESVKAMVKGVSIGRIGSVEDVADVVVFLSECKFSFLCLFLLPTRERKGFLLAHAVFSFQSPKVKGESLRIIFSSILLIFLVMYSGRWSEVYEWKCS